LQEVISALGIDSGWITGDPEVTNYFLFADDSSSNRPILAL
jgi:hypothetical protein